MCEDGTHRVNKKTTVNSHDRGDTRHNSAPDRCMHALLCRDVSVRINSPGPAPRLWLGSSKMAVNQVQDSHVRTTRSRHGFSQSEQVPAILCITEKWIRKRLNLQLDSLGQFTSINFTCPIMTWVLRMMVMAFLSLVARTYPRKRGSGGIQMIPLRFERDIIRNFMCMCA